MGSRKRAEQTVLEQLEAWLGLKRRWVVVDEGEVVYESEHKDWCEAYIEALESDDARLFSVVGDDANVTRNVTRTPERQRIFR